MSWNLRGAAKPRLDSVVEIVQAHEPDVLALQEVRRGQARRIAGLLGWRRPAWALKHNPYWPAWWLAEGLALLSHHRLAVHPPVVLTPEINRRTFRRRILLPAEVLLEDDQRVLVIDAHLSSGDDDELRRAAGRTTSLSILPDSLPTVFVGDLNATPRAGRSTTLIGGGLLDAWPAAAASGRAGLHVPGQRPAPPDRLRDGQRRRRAVAEVSVPDDLGAAMSGLSDHRPLLVRLELPEPSPGLACGGDQRDPRCRPARPSNRATQPTPARGRRRCAAQPGDRASCTPATTCRRTCSTRPTACWPSSSRWPQEVKQQFVAPGSHGQTGYTGPARRDGGVERRARLEGDAQLGPRACPPAIRCARATRTATGRRCCPRRPCPGITEGADDVPRPHRRPPAALPAGHRRGASAATRPSSTR